MFSKKRVADLLARALERDREHLLVGALDDLAHAAVVDVARSSNTNIRLRIDTARSGASPSIASSTGVLTLRSSRLNSSATARTPPCCSWVPPPSDFSRCSMTDEMRAMTSGEISSRLAIRVSTSTRRSSGSSADQLRGLCRLEMREDQRDRLRMLGQDELRELLRVGLLEGGEADRGLERLHEPIEQPLGHLADRATSPAASARSRRRRARRTPPPATCCGTRRGPASPDCRAHAAEHRHFAGDLLDLVLAAGA